MNTETDNAREARNTPGKNGKLESPDGFIVGVPLAGRSFAEQRAAYWRLAKEGAIQPTVHYDPTAAGEHDALVASLDREAQAEEAE